MCLNNNYDAVKRVIIFYCALKCVQVVTGCYVIIHSSINSNRLNWISLFWSTSIWLVGLQPVGILNWITQSFVHIELAHHKRRFWYVHFYKRCWNITCWRLGWYGESLPSIPSTLVYLGINDTSFILVSGVYWIIDNMDKKEIFQGLMAMITALTNGEWVG